MAEQSGEFAGQAALITGGASGIGLAATVLVQVVWPDTAYQILVGVSLFGALFVWLMIFTTHIAFRRPHHAIGSYIGAIVLFAILISTHWVPGLESTLLAGGPWLALLVIGYRAPTHGR